jgi:hypothetical protein
VSVLLLRGRRGDAAFVLLVVVAIAAVLTAGMVLVRATHSIESEAGDMELLSSDAENQEAYAVAVSEMLGAAVIHESGGRENESLAGLFVAASLDYAWNLKGSQGYFERIASRGVVFVATEEGYELHISDIPISVVREQHKLQRKLSLHFAFDGQGKARHNWRS